MQTNALIIFTRIPIKNKTKTRLQALLTPQECAELHYAFLQDISITCSLSEYDLFLFHGDEGDVSLLDDFFHNAPRYAQQGNTLGDRMCHAMDTIFKLGYQKVGLMGTDIPEVQLKSIKKGFDLLNNNDLVFGLTNDGGYYLVLSAQLYPEIFMNDITWGHASVWEETLNTISQNKINNIAYTDSYNDIDIPEDLKTLSQRINPCTHTGSYIKRLLGEKNDF